MSASACATAVRVHMRRRVAFSWEWLVYSSRPWGSTQSVHTYACHPQRHHTLRDTPTRWGLQRRPSRVAVPQRLDAPLLQHTWVKWLINNQVVRTTLGNGRACHGGPLVVWFRRVGPGTHPEVSGNWNRKTRRGFRNSCCLESCWCAVLEANPSQKGSLKL